MEMIEISTGLYQDLRSFTVGGVVHYYSELYSADGYCFYDVDDVYYDDEGNVIPDEDVLPSQRIYARNITTPITDVEELRAKFISVPIDPSYEIVSAETPRVDI